MEVKGKKADHQGCYLLLNWIVSYSVWLDPPPPLQKKNNNPISLSFACFFIAAKSLNLFYFGTIHKHWAIKAILWVGFVVGNKDFFSLETLVALGNDNRSIHLSIFCEEGSQRVGSNFQQEDPSFSH